MLKRAESNKTVTAPARTRTPGARVSHAAISFHPANMINAIAGATQTK
jgi:hypothetical protein